MLTLFYVSLVLATVLMVALFHPKYREYVFRYEDVLSASGFFLAVSMIVSGISSFVVGQ